MYMFKNLIDGGNRKEATLKSYESRLKTLNGGNEVDNLAFLYNYDGILEQIQKYKITTQRNFIIAIVSVLKPVKVMRTMYETYSKLLEKYNTELKTNNYKSEKQKDNWIDQAEVIKVYDDLHKNVYPILFEKKKSITENKFNNITQLILLSLFVLQQPRRLLDYMSMVMVNTIPKEMDKSLNYYDITNGIFYFNNYKTSGTYKTQEVKACDRLRELLRYYIMVHPTKLTFKNKIWLLCKYDGTPFTNVSSLTRILNKIFMTSVGKQISSNLLRSIYLTDTFKPEMDKLESVSYNMGTSPDMVKNVYVKKD